MVHRLRAVAKFCTVSVDVPLPLSRTVGHAKEDATTPSRSSRSAPAGTWKRFDPVVDARDHLLTIPGRLDEGGIVDPAERRIALRRRHGGGASGRLACSDFALAVRASERSVRASNH